MDEPEINELRQEFEESRAKLADPPNIDTNSKQYWQKIFKIMDEYSAIPIHKRKAIVQQTLNNEQLIQAVEQIYDIKEHDSIIDFDAMMKSEEAGSVDSKANMDAKWKNKFTFMSSQSAVDMTMKELKRRLKKVYRTSLPPSSDIELKPYTYVDFRKEITANKMAVKDPGEESMYTKFLNKSPEEASRWRPRPPVTWDGLPLADKCDAITKEIAKNFVEWMNGLSGEIKTNIDVKGITELFEIGFSCHAADSLKLKIQELNAVPEYVATARRTPEMSVSTQLYRQLYRDKTAVRNRETNFAFGTMLPPEMRSGTTQDSDVSKWLENKRVPEKLATMAVVWEDIEKLKTTEGYCLWLQEHDEITPPLYLVEKGIVENVAKTIAEPPVETSNVSVQSDRPKTSSISLFD